MTETVRMLLIWLGSISILTLLLFGWDKLMAKTGHSRIPEIGLLAATFFGGGAGALLGMLLFATRSAKRLFPCWFPCFFCYRFYCLASHG